MDKIHSKDAPKAVWPYSQGISVNWTVYLSAQLGIDPTSWELKGSTTEEQFRQVCINIGHVLKAWFLDYINVVKATIYLTNMDDFPKINEIFWEFFPHKPARATVEISRLAKDALIEMDVIAVENIDK